MPSRELRKLRTNSAVSATLYRHIHASPGKVLYFLGWTGDNGAMYAVQHVPEVAAAGTAQDPDALWLCYCPYGNTAAFSGLSVDDCIYIDQNLVIVESGEEGSADSEIDTFDLLRILQSGKYLRTVISDFKPRDVQLSMLETVCESFNKHRTCVVEAGTGTGKSFAYLFAAMRYAEQNAGRIVISTATITLQQQLIEKDIPIVQQALDINIPVTLVKGKGNYLCPRRLNEYIQAPTLLESEEKKLESLISWAEKSKTGDRSELPIFVPDALWQEISVDTDSCFTHKCPNRQACFVRKAREKAAQSRVLVTNHHLLFSDLSIRFAGGIPAETTLILPPVQHIIFDEAHVLEERLTSMFSTSCSMPKLQRYLRTLLSASSGIIAWLQEMGFEQAVYRYMEILVKNIDALKQCSLDFMADKERTFLLQEWKWTAEPEFAAAIKNCASALEDLHICLEDFYERHSVDEVGDSRREIMLQQLIQGLQKQHTVLSSFLADELKGGEIVYWLESTGKGINQHVRFTMTPLHVASIMQQLVLDNYRTLIFCSASLRVEESFDFWAQALGMHDRDCSYLALPSPFAHESQVLFLVPDGVPDPNSSEYPEYLCNLVEESILCSGGGALVLFTSYSSMRYTFEKLQQKFRSMQIDSMMQGTEDRYRLLNRFRNNKNSVLFATDSFWEGIDAPGATLRMLVICRLPFRYPSDPIRKARNIAIEKAGGSPFIEHALPTAVLRFKQGFGRLIRSEKDRGVIIVADQRLYTKHYGSVFLNSIPRCRHLHGSLNALREQIKNFYDV